MKVRSSLDTFGDLEGPERFSVKKEKVFLSLHFTEEETGPRELAANPELDTNPISPAKRFLLYDSSLPLSSSLQCVCVGNTSFPERDLLKGSYNRLGYPIRCYILKYNISVSEYFHQII